jgi:hypothetical protein
MHKSSLTHVILDVPVIEEVGDIIIDPSRSVRVELMERLD